MIKTDFAKYQKFFSTKYNSNAKINESPDNYNPQNSTLSKSRRSYSIQHLKNIKDKQIMQSRVSDFLTNRKLGLITTENNEEIKLLKRYSEGNKNQEEMALYLKQLKSEHNQFTSKTLKTNIDIQRLNLKIKLAKQRISNYQNTNRFTEETSNKKNEQHLKISYEIQRQSLNSKIYKNVLDRTKTVNEQIKNRVNILRNRIRSKDISLSHISKSIEIKQKKNQLSIDVTNKYKYILKRNSFQLNKHLKLAKETIEAKVQFIKVVKQNQELRQKAAKQYQLKFLNDSQLWKQLYAHKFEKTLLNRIFFRQQQKSQPLQKAFSMIKNRTAIIDVTEFKKFYFESFDTSKKLEIKVKQLEQVQQKLQIINKNLISQYMQKALQFEQNPKKIDQVVNLRLYDRNMYIKNAKQIHSKISIWCSKMQFRLKELYGENSDQVDQGNKMKKQISNQQVIKKLIMMLKNKLLQKQTKQAQTNTEQ